jgi:protein TonB
MNFKTFNLNNSHLFSLIGASLLHVAIAGLVLLPSRPILINQQTIQISFVAPSGLHKKSENSSQPKNTINLERENALQKTKNKKSENQSEKKSLAKKETSGIENEKATETNSAQSEPIFNAAYLNNPSPNYPARAKRQGIQGKVLISVLVKTDGSAAAAQIQHSSGSSDLDQAALEAVKEWKFIPARRSGQLFQASVIVPVEFKII